MPLQSTSTPTTFPFAKDGQFSALTVNGMIYPTADGSSGQVMATDGRGNLSLKSISGTGTVVGPATTVVGDVAVWNNATGSLLKDSQVHVSGGAITATTATVSGSLAAGSVATTTATVTGTVSAAAVTTGTLAATGNSTLAGGVVLNGMTFPATMGTAGQILSTNGAGVLSWINH